MSAAVISKILIHFETTDFWHIPELGYMYFVKGEVGYIYLKLTNPVTPL